MTSGSHHQEFGTTRSLAPLEEFCVYRSEVIVLKIESSRPNPRSFNVKIVRNTTTLRRPGLFGVTLGHSSLPDHPFRLR